MGSYRHSSSADKHKDYETAFEQADPVQSIPMRRYKFKSPGCNSEQEWKFDQLLGDTVQFARKIARVAADPDTALLTEQDSKLRQYVLDQEERFRHAGYNFDPGESIDLLPLRPF